jgi:crotonobetainyl-CoA:carnitine CoA-transferase CaiB-like acyl-CoA transferase
MTSKPLTGLRIVEMSHMIMGPSCGMFLALMGADVIKVEPPGGDRTRQLTGMGAGFFPLFNRGKRSITLDLTTEAGRAAFHRLLDTADGFVENFREGALAERGLGAEALREQHPRLIIVSHKGFLSGPYQNRTAMDEVVQMMTGLAYMTGPSGRPLRVGSSVNDIMGGLFGAFGLLAALRDRDSTGKGDEVRVGLFENCLLLVAQHMVQFELEGTVAPPMPERDFSWPVYDIFQTADGEQLFVGAVTTGQWQALCNLLGLEDLLGDSRLQSQMDRINSRDWVVPRFADAIRKRTNAELVPQMEALNIPHAPIAKPADLYRDPHVNHPGILTRSHMPDGKEFRAPGLPIEIGRAPVCEVADVPRLGEHTEAILREIGCSDEQVRAVMAT